jgi:hypothetical protein
MATMSHSHPRSVRPVLATSLLVLMVSMGMGQAPSGQTAGVQVAREADPGGLAYFAGMAGLLYVFVTLPLLNLAH